MRSLFFSASFLFAVFFFPFFLLSWLRLGLLDECGWSHHMPGWMRDYEMMMDLGFWFCLRGMVGFCWDSLQDTSSGFLWCGAICMAALSGSSGNVGGWMFDVFLSLAVAHKLGPPRFVPSVCLGVSLRFLGCCCCCCCCCSASVLGVCWFFFLGVAQIPPVFICAAPCWLASGGRMSGC